MTRECFGWGPPATHGLASRNHTYLPKVHGDTPAARRRARRHKRPKLASTVWQRDGYACRKCGYEAPMILIHNGRLVDGVLFTLTVDHVIPSCCGGTDEPFNLVTLCRSCNTRRGAYLPDPVTLL